MRKKIIYSGIMLGFLTFLFAVSFMNFNLELISPTLNQAIAIGFTFFIGMSIIILTYKKGIKITMFVLVSNSLLLIVIELLFRIFLTNFASTALQSECYTPLNTNLTDLMIYTSHHYTLYTLTSDIKLDNGTGII